MTWIPDVERPSRCGAQEEKSAKGVLRVYYLPWWLLLTCLVASALAAYLFLRPTQAGDSPWVLFPLTTALAPVVLVGAVVAAITLSTLLSEFVEGRTGPSTDHPSEPRALTERTRSRTTIVDRTQPATTQEQTMTTSTVTSTATATAAPTSTAIATP